MLLYYFNADVNRPKMEASENGTPIQHWSILKAVMLIFNPITTILHIFKVISFYTFENTLGYISSLILSTVGVERTTTHTVKVERKKERKTSHAKTS